eukprot:5367721-Prymnesium_polylepis.1
MITVLRTLKVAAHSPRRPGARTGSSQALEQPGHSCCEVAKTTLRRSPRIAPKPSVRRVCVPDANRAPLSSKAAGRQLSGSTRTYQSDRAAGGRRPRDINSTMKPLKVGITLIAREYVTVT